MPEFGSPFSGMASDKKLSHAELVRKLIDTLYEQAVLNGNPKR